MQSVESPLGHGSPTFWHVVDGGYALKYLDRRARSHGHQVADCKAVAWRTAGGDRIACADVARLPNAQVGT